MTLGLAERQGDLLDDLNRFCDEKLSGSSIYAFLHRERDNLFPDEFFADLFSERGRRSVPPCVVAVVMVLQRLEGLSDREAVERYAFDARWRYAAGVGGYDSGAWTNFSHTVLVDMRERLRRSADRDRVLRVSLEAAKAAGVLGRRRVLDSTPLYDAVATMDTVTLIRSAIRALLGMAGDDLEARLRAVLASGDDYATSAKPQIDWDDPTAREALIDSVAKDGFLALIALEAEAELSEAVTAAGILLAEVLGQDLELSADGRFRIARKVAPDRIISTVDPQARHGHKTAAKGFDGYKGHASVDPDSEIITATAVTPGNVGDAAVAAELIADVLSDQEDKASHDGHRKDHPSDDHGSDHSAQNDTTEPAATPAQDDSSPHRPKVYGDNAYGTGAFQSRLEDADIDSGCKTQTPTAPGGRYSKDRFSVDLDGNTVTCPAGVTVKIRRHKDGSGLAHFAKACTTCPLRGECTNNQGGRTIGINRHEAALSRARARQASSDWKDDYRRTRPKVERKLSHLMRRKHGGRRARVRGTTKVAADFALLAGAANLARLAVLGVAGQGGGRWAPA
jgi:IS5 family transposase